MQMLGKMAALFPNDSDFGKILSDCCSAVHCCHRVQPDKSEQIRSILASPYCKVYGMSTIVFWFGAFVGDHQEETGLIKVDTQTMMTQAAGSLQ